MHALNKRYRTFFFFSTIILILIGTFSIIYEVSVVLISKDANNSINYKKLNEKIFEKIKNVKIESTEDFYFNKNYSEKEIDKILDIDSEGIKTGIYNKTNKKIEKIKQKEENKEKGEENNEEGEEEKNEQEENNEGGEDNKDGNSSKYDKYYNKYYEFDDNVERNTTYLDIFSMMIPDSEEIESPNPNLTNTFPEVTVKLCAEKKYLPAEGIKGNRISCPVGYVINIKDVFFGRRHDDKQTCSENEQGIKYADKLLTVKEDEKCETHPVKYVKALCENKRQCNIKVTESIFESPCPDRHSYMEVNYQCIQDNNIFEKPNFAIVMLADKIVPNTIYEHSISEFAQYADTHGYYFFLDDLVMDHERQIYYQKLYSVMYYVMQGLKEKTYDWIFWVDSDSTLINPNLSLDSFIPPLDKDNVHFVIADDINGLNAGMFLIRVHPWSLSFLMRACSYSYFNKDTFLTFADQSALLHILIEHQEDDHYMIVPQNWFNSYYCGDNPCEGELKKGDFLVHYAGYVNKGQISEMVRDMIKKDKEWYSRSSREMRETVLNYYRLPKDEQHHISL